MKKPKKAIRLGDMGQVKLNSKVRLQKAGNGYFIIIRDKYSDNRMAVTKDELLILKHILNSEIK
jgi:hypothetical protein